MKLCVLSIVYSNLARLVSSFNPVHISYIVNSSSLEPFATSIALTHDRVPLALLTECQSSNAQPFSQSLIPVSLHAHAQFPPANFCLIGSAFSMFSGELLT